MKGPCSSSCSDLGWIRLLPCPSHTQMRGCTTCPGSQLCATPFHLSVSPSSQVKADQSRLIPATRWCFWPQVHLSLKVQKLPASRIFPLVPQLGTCCAGACSLRARRAALHRQASLCPSCFREVLFLAISGKKWPYYCVLEMKAGGIRRETPGPRPSYIRGAGLTFGWPVPAPGPGISDIPLPAELAKFFTQLHSDVYLLTASTEGFVHYTSQTT